jgi:hypothetical protein
VFEGASLLSFFNSELKRCHWVSWPEELESVV